MLGDSAVTMFSSFKNAIIDTFGAEGAVVKPNILEKTDENALFFSKLVHTIENRFRDAATAAGLLLSTKAPNAGS